MTAGEILYGIGSGLMVLAVIPANYIPFKYHWNLPWTQTTIGKVFMSKGVAIALVLDLAIARVFLGDHIVFAALRTAVFGYFVVALYWQASVLRGVIEDARAALAAARQARTNGTDGSSNGHRWPE